MKKKPGIEPIEKFDDLLSALQSNDPSQRHHAALQLEGFSETAIDALFKTIARPENRNHIGTLVYVLRLFNCESHFTDLFELALNGNFEVQNHALFILWRQNFAVTAEQLKAAGEALNSLQERDNLTADDIKLLRKDLQSILKRIAQSV